jgi:hypothetical protein
MKEEITLKMLIIRTASFIVSIIHRVLMNNNISEIK